jgi:RNA polymerase sigma factor (sigma-70 family)
MKTRTTSEGEFPNLFREIVEGKKPIDSLFEHHVFTRRARQMCSYISRQNSETDADDLFQEACLKVFMYRAQLKTDNIPDANAFFRWFYVVARNISRSRMRRVKMPMDTKRAEEMSVIDPKVNLDDKHLLREFMESIKVLPNTQRRATAYWLEGYSLREISQVFRREKVEFSHVTVQRWVKDALMNFSNRDSSINTKLSNETRRKLLRRTSHKMKVA